MQIRTVVAFKNATGGNPPPDDPVVRITGVPDAVSTADVVRRLETITLLPMRGPWTIPWERLADAALYSIIRT